MESEFDLIAALVERLPPPGGQVRVGSGDDAAVTEPRAGASATTVDAIVEGVHFTLPEFPLRAVGRKALAASLSDLAAMGAEPGEAYVALGVPDGLGHTDLIELADGLAEVAEREGVSVVGGDVTRAPALSLAVTCIGHEPDGAGFVTRSGARPGDVVAVTGELGGAAAALKLLTNPASSASRPGTENNPTSSASRPGVGAELDADVRERLLARQLDPRPRLEAGRALARHGATAMIDVSDGIGADAGHMARASRVRVEIEAGRLPLAPGAAEVAGGEDGAVALALSGGEDFELLLALPADRMEEARAGLDALYGLTEIGRITEGEGIVVLARDGRELEPGGFDHMRGSGAGSS
jgi:thiamine-monophosphate kinase